MRRGIKPRQILNLLFSGEGFVSVIIYLLIFYVLFVYAVMPAVYAFTDISYISAVVSSSMDHSSPTIQITYNNWLAENGFNSSSTSHWPFQDGVPLGSLVVAYKMPAANITVGDVIIYTVLTSSGSEDIIHRVISEHEINGSYYYTTKGDANPESLPFELNIPYTRVVGVVGISIPYLGLPRYLLSLI